MKKKRKYTKRPGIVYGRPKGRKKKPAGQAAGVQKCAQGEVAAICAGLHIY